VKFINLRNVSVTKKRNILIRRKEDTSRRCKLDLNHPNTLYDIIITNRGLLFFSLHSCWLYHYLRDMIYVVNTYYSRTIYILRRRDCVWP